MWLSRRVLKCAVHLRNSVDTDLQAGHDVVSYDRLSVRAAGRIGRKHTGLLSRVCLFLRSALMCCFKALESSGFSSSKLQRSSAETDMTAPQLSNSPQY